MSQKRKICFITGTRADYGLLVPVMSLVEKSNKLDLCLIVTGMHLLKEYGHTFKEIKKDNFKVYKINIDSKQKNQAPMGEIIGREIIEFSQKLMGLKPDLVVVLGDRGEMLAMAIAANYQNIPVVHIHGGEISGHVDGIVRHAITKLAHLHFAATSEARKRIINMGEEPWRVITSGAPGLDAIFKMKTPSKQEIYNIYKIDKNKPLIIVVQHPVLKEKDEATKQITATLKAILKYKCQVVIIYPNSDVGSDRIIKEIERYREHPLVQIYRSIPRQDYLGLLKIADVLVGNSSSGIIEAASFKLPVIDIGTRQESRQRGTNVLHTGYNEKEISEILNKILSRDKLLMSKLQKVRNPYNKGDASHRIVQVLQKVDISKLLAKKMTY